MIVHDRDNGRDGVPKRPLHFEKVSEKAVRLPGDSVMGEIAYVRAHHLIVHGGKPTSLRVGRDKIGTLLSELQQAEPNMTLDDLPDSRIAGMTVAFDFSMNGIRVE